MNIQRISLREKAIYLMISDLFWSIIIFDRNFSIVFEIKLAGKRDCGNNFRAHQTDCLLRGVWLNFRINESGHLILPPWHFYRLIPSIRGQTAPLQMSLLHTDPSRGRVCQSTWKSMSCLWKKSLNLIIQNSSSPRVISALYIPFICQKVVEDGLWLGEKLLLAKSD